MIHRILVGLAGTTYTPVAIERAVTLAKTHNAVVTGVTVLDVRQIRNLGHATPSWEGADSIRDQCRAITETRITQSIRDFVAACQTASIKHQVLEESGDPFDRLIDLARYHDLMVFGLRSVIEYDFLCPDPQALLVKLVSANVRPLLAVSSACRAIERVLIAYSGSMESAQAMKRFVQLQLWPEACLKLFTFHPSDDEAHRLLSAAEEFCRAHGRSVEHQSNPGEARHLLLAAASLCRADLIVMGSGSRSMLLRRALGDTLQSVLQDTNLPLFLG